MTQKTTVASGMKWKIFLKYRLGKSPIASIIFFFVSFYIWYKLEMVYILNLKTTVFWFTAYNNIHICSMYWYVGNMHSVDICPIQVTKCLHSFIRIYLYKAKVYSDTYVDTYAICNCWPIYRECMYVCMYFILFI